MVLNGRITNIQSFVVIIFAFILKKTDTRSCPASLSTVVDVERCPRNELEWKTRAKLYNCRSINQSCVDPEYFEYHCVLNTNGTRLLELCAPPANIYASSCAEFNFYGNLIQESSISCSDAFVPCQNVYRSTEAYKYQSCYDIVHHVDIKGDQFNQHSTNSSGSTDNVEDKVHLNLGLFVAIAFGCFVLGACSAMMLIFLRNMRRHSTETSETSAEYMDVKLTERCQNI
uniref:Uncharacterized protein LOC111102979 n=1 Tax=Crassostrea virginica TaxID=6565 RepID=A0A8B8AJD2_CRAVI|nr:uncharacterized protein LOC111102979 [Crassostrea virginica]XP_022291647.1 uncharacterized protein LOC111102979 [Crassostrea virginica]XP_022291648.1 uncharacterized protein LOC111102979 [Crassostrea virginica]